MDPQVHLAAFYITKRGWKRHSRIYRATVDHVADELEITRREAVDLLEDMAAADWIEFGDDKRIRKPSGVEEELCGCKLVDMRSSLPIGCEPGRPRTHSEQREEGGSGEDWKPSSEGARAPRAIARTRERSAPRSRAPRQTAGQRRETALEKPVDNLTAWDLTYILKHRIREVGRDNPAVDGWVQAGAVVEGPVRKNIALWLREDGVPPRVVREMIEVFVEDTRLLAREGQAWKTFLNRRATLEEKARRRLGAEHETTVVGSSTPDLGWSESAEIQKARLKELRQRAMKHRTED